MNQPFVAFRVTDEEKKEIKHFMIECKCKTYKELLYLAMDLYKNNQNK